VPQPTLSLSMIVRDEEDSLAGVLEDAARFCDELVVVDTGSVDRTVEIAQSFGTHVFHFDWINDFSAARNYAFDHCSGLWILWLDADDRIPAQAWPGLRSIVEELPRLVDFDVITLPYEYEFSDTDPSLCTYSQACGRIIRNSPDLRWIGKIHEYVPHAQDKAVWRKDAWVEHRPLPEHEAKSAMRNLRAIEQCLAEGDRSARMLHYYALMLESQGHHVEAFNTCQEILSLEDSRDLDPGYTASSLTVGRYQTLLLMANCAAKLGMANEQIELLARAVVLDSERPEAFMELGRCFFEKREWRRAIPFFTAAATLTAPGPADFNPAFYSWLPWDYLAVCASEIGDYKGALEYTSRALPGHPEKERLVANMRIYAEHL